MPSSRKSSKRRPSSSPHMRGEKLSAQRKRGQSSSSRRALSSAKVRSASNARGHGAKSGFLSRVRHATREFLENETKAGFLLIGVAMAALIIANTPLYQVYHDISHFKVGPDSIGSIPLGMHLSIHQWAADGVLTLFFFVVGLELKTEFVTGALRDLREASLPMIAAAFGMIGPAFLYVTMQYLSGANAYHGWAVPTATDIAFAVALLGVFGRGMPPAARTFLLTLAVVDDLLAIIVIALFYSSTINFFALGIAIVVIAVFALLVNRRITKWWILIPLAVLAWGLMFNSGIHATIAGVALGLVVPANRDSHGHQMTHSMVEKLGPWSSGVALPFFAFFSAGVPVLGAEGGISGALADPVTFAIALSLPFGKLLGIWGSVAVLTRYTKLRLGNGVDLPDIAAIALLAGIGFTVAMLVAGLAFTNEVEVFHASFGVILGTFLAAVLGAIALKWRTSQKVRHS